MVQLFYLFQVRLREFACRFFGSFANRFLNHCFGFRIYWELFSESRHIPPPTPSLHISRWAISKNKCNDWPTLGKRYQLDEKRRVYQFLQLKTYQNVSVDGKFSDMKVILAIILELITIAD